jgi:hypothetical protein
MQYSDPLYAANPRSRHYHAYREWQRTSAIKDAESFSSSITKENEE